MTAVHLGEVVPFLDNPEPSGVKIARAASGPDAPPAPAPLSRDALLAQYGAETAYAPKWHTGSFRAPLGMRGPAFQQLVYQQTTTWLEAMRKKGFDVCSSSEIDVTPGPYPAKDLATGLVILGEREMLVRAQFLERQPIVRRVELPGELFRASPESGGEE